MNETRGPQKTLRTAALATTAALSLALNACGIPGNGAPDQEQMSGRVRMDGSSTVAPLAAAAAKAYTQKQPDVRISVNTSGTGGGFRKLCSGQTDITNASRPIEDDEKSACRRRGITYKELPIANDALTVVVNKETTWVDCLSTRQLRKIWKPGSQITHWDQLDPRYPHTRLSLYGADADSGTFDYFTHSINGKEGATRTDYTPAKNDNTIVKSVTKTPGSMGYFGFSYYEENENYLKALMIDNGNGCIIPSLTTVQNNTYQPLSRPLYLYPTTSSLKKPHTRNFIDYLTTHHSYLTATTQYIPLNPTQQKQLTATTH